MKKLKVLLVDDETIIREGFKRLFDWEAHDCEIVGEAADGIEAYTKIDTLKPDLVIMDINIPIMNGLKVIQSAKLRYPEMAFIIVSGYDDFSYCREALRLQITDYLLKPVDYEEFGNCIERLRISIFEQQFGKLAGDSQPGNMDDPMIARLTMYLHENLNQEISLASLSEEFHLNPQYISQLFKNEIGVGFQNYLSGIRTEKAKQLLLSTSLPIGDIAEMTGYSDYRVFTKAFKKIAGMTPSQYRNDFLDNPG